MTASVDVSLGTARPGSRRAVLAGGAVLVGLAAVAAAGCGAAKDTSVPNPHPTTQGVVIRFGAKDGAPASVTEMQQTAKEDFEPTFPGARVEIEPLTGAASYFEKLLALLAAGTEQDTAQFDEYYVPFLVTRGGIQPMDQYASHDKQFDPKGLYPVPYQGGRFQNKLYGLTTEPNALVLVYNRSAFDEAGLAPPPSDYKDKTWTWNRMREDARKLTRLGAAPPDSRFGFMWDVALFSRFSGQVRSNAGKIVDRDEDPRMGALDDPHSIELFTILQEMRHRDRIAPTDDDLKTTPVPAVANGRLAMQVVLASVGTAYKDVTFKWDIAPLPRANSSGQAGTTVITNVYGMMKSTKHPELSWAWNRVIGGAKRGLWHVREKQTMPTWKSLRDEYLKLPPAHRQAALDAADYGLPSISSPRYVEMQDLVLQGLAPIWAGTAPVKQTIDQLMPRLNDLLKTAA
jgi:ABC-type glycerol-3-phosphate transport system substrate-binding protein